jgi:hypothetical protein
MIDEIQSLLDSYSRWLRDKTRIRQLDDWCEITTPFLDRHNDFLQIYVRRQDDGYLLTDDGYVIDDLESSGCHLDSPKRKALLLTALNGFGVQIIERALQVNANANDFPVKKHNLIQAMLSVNDMFFLANPSAKSLFCEDVAGWLDIHEVRYVPRVKFAGKTGFDYSFDFAIGKFRDQPERLVKTISHPNRSTTIQTAMSWLDTKAARRADSRFYAFLNDADQPISKQTMDALAAYEVRPVPWSQREEVINELAA